MVPVYTHVTHVCLLRRVYSHDPKPNREKPNVAFNNDRKFQSGANSNIIPNSKHPNDIMSFKKHLWCVRLVLIEILVVTATASAATSSHSPVPGVGFSLTPDYGTAAIYFQNGSHVEVARIEGSPAYKSFMRKRDNTTSIVKALPGISLLRNTVCSPLQPLGLAICKRDPDFDSCQGLLRSLSSSVASYLGTTFCYAGVVVPDKTWQCQDYIINKAIESIGLRLTHQVLSAASLVLWANHIHNPGTPHDTTQAVLSVDYSASGLNANLFADARGVADVLRNVYDQKLGAGRQEQPGHFQAVKALLTEVTKPPLGRDPYGSLMPDNIQRVVLYGDAVKNEGLLDTLRAVVDLDKVDNAQSLDPVFAAAIGMAAASFERMNWVDFNVKPAFGCRWRSRLYDATSEEL